MNVRLTPIKNRHFTAKGPRKVARMATTQVDCQGDQLTPEMLEKISGQIAGMKVLVDFEPALVAGNALSGSVDGDGLNVVVQLFEYLKFPLHERFVVPGLIVKSFEVTGDDTRVLTDVDLFSIGLTDKPADKHLTPMRDYEQPAG